MQCREIFYVQPKFVILADWRTPRKCYLVLFCARDMRDGLDAQSSPTLQFPLDVGCTILMLICLTPAVSLLLADWQDQVGYINLSNPTRQMSLSIYHRPASEP
jgi:hypothetical protein